MDNVQNCDSYIRVLVGRQNKIQEGITSKYKLNSENASYQSVTSFTYLVPIKL
jgi:hypothetical protein